MLVFLNGAFIPHESARISVFDRGFIFGDGVYEVLPVIDGAMLRVEQHLDRLERSLAGTGIQNPYPRARWRAILQELVACNGGGDLTVYLQVTRGTAALETIRDLVPAAPLAPTVLVAAAPRRRLLPEPISVVTLPDNRWQRCDLKVTSLLPNILLRREALARGARDAILIRDGLVSEATAANVFAVIDGEIRTPAKSHLLLHGVTRDLLIELLNANDLPVRECDVTHADLRWASEIWLTGSVRETSPVVSLDGAPVGNGEPGPIWRRVHAVYGRYRDSLPGSGTDAGTLPEQVQRVAAEAGDER
jgi:D-alanine transaminase